MGFADQCAPSRRGPSKRDQAYLNAWLEKGFAVVATDYQGLGTEGVHPYLLYRPEAYSALDAARAVIGDRSLDIQNRIVLIGQSQGRVPRWPLHGNIRITHRNFILSVGC